MIYTHFGLWKFAYAQLTWIPPLVSPWYENCICGKHLRRNFICCIFLRLVINFSSNRPDKKWGNSMTVQCSEMHFLAWWGRNTSRGPWCDILDGESLKKISFTEMHCVFYSFWLKIDIFWLFFVAKRQFFLQRRIHPMQNCWGEFQMVSSMQIYGTIFNLARKPSFLTFPACF